jgi:transcriptional regulator with XRE-family HTH domain
MTYAALAKRSGVSMPTVVRILSGGNEHASFGNVAAIAEALGMTIDIVAKERSQTFLEKQAEEKARRIVAMVQGTSGLEAQAVDANTLDEMTRRTVHELMAGSPRRLWGD